METLRETEHYTEVHETKISRVSWAAIFGGTLIMLVTLMLLSLLGIGIGIGSINPMEEAQPMKGLGTGTLIWWVISNIIAVFAGSFTAAKLTNVTFKLSGIIHGILTWSLYTLISFWLMTSAVGAIISGVGGVVSKSLSAVGAGLSEIPDLAEQLDTERINKLIQDALAEDQELGSQTGQEFDIDVMAVVKDLFIRDGELNTRIERAEVERAVARHSTLTRRDVVRASDVIIREYENIRQELQQLEQRARETGQEVAEAVSTAAIWAFVALLLGLITSAIGGRVGRPDIITDPTFSATR
jgi:hypothetical protein